MTRGSLNDAEGNLTGTTTHPAQITYNSGNQATSLAPLSGSGTSDSPTYTDQGNQLRSAVGGDSFDNGPLGITALTNTGGTTYCTRDPQGNLIDEHGASGTYDYLTDRNNSVLALINSSGADAGDYTYDPYGNLTNTASLTTTATANPWRYDSGYQDTEGDNDYHFGARYYDPTIGAFTQPDTVTGNIANPHTVNLYAYANGDPIDNTDPTGHGVFGDVAAVGSAVGTVASATVGAITAVGAATDAAAGAVADTASEALAGAAYGFLGGVTAAGFFALGLGFVFGAAYFAYQATQD